jgi:NAD(P)-dependent dehydrogenase (short-subunit alcohol dehydrogenase family)
MPVSQKNWFITGCSTGLGRALAECALRKGDRVAITARNVAAIEELGARFPTTGIVLPLDVTNSASIDHAVSEAIKRLGDIDVLINNAAYGVNGPLEETTADQYRQLFDTNYFGPVEVMRRVLPNMRARRHGHVINISSLAAIAGAAETGHYAASKAALAMASEVLAEEVRPLGLKVTIIELGTYPTSGVGNMQWVDSSIPDYRETAATIRKLIIEYSGHEVGDTNGAARAIIQIAEEAQPPVRLPLGTDAVALAYATLEKRRAELDAWRVLGESTARTPS